MRDLEIIRRRLVASIRQSIPLGCVPAVLPDGRFADVNYRDRRLASWGLVKHLQHLEVLARDGGESAIRALDHWLKHDYQSENGWFNEIGVPRSLACIALLLGDELTGERRRKVMKIITRAKVGWTGANLMDLGMITLQRGVLEGDAALVKRVAKRMAREIKITSGEGIQADFSFHQHEAMLYNHGYGSVFLKEAAALIQLLEGTAFRVAPEKVDLVCRLLLDGNRWMIRHRTLDMSAVGRGITRPRGQQTGIEPLIPIIRALLAVKTRHAPALREFLKHKPLTGNRHFWRSDYMAHHRPSYSFSIRMCSDRLFDTDWPCDGEGLLSHHIADGCTFLMRSGREYHDIFPLWDWHKIPGTTVQLGANLGEMHVRGVRPFAGGVSDGRYGCAAFDFEKNGLFARKAWFLFDDEIVCLGAGIRCKQRHRVITTINQCYRRGPVVVAKSSVRHDGVTYLFPETTRFQLSKDRRTGSWWRINRNYAKTPVTGNVFTLWLDHGIAPKNASYAYIVLPAGKTRSPVEILVNEPSRQVVRHPQLGVTGFAFYEPGSACGVSVDRPCLLLVRDDAVTAAGNGRLRVRIKNHGPTVFQLSAGRSVTQWTR